MKKKLLAVLLAASMVVGLAACGGKSQDGGSASGGDADASGGDLPVLKVAVMPFLNCLPVEYMIENGLDEENGFKIETVYFANGTAMNEALAADQWEVGTLSAAAVNSLAIYGAYCIADIGHSEGGLYTLAKADSPIAEIKGANPSYPEVYGDADSVKGTTIATQTGTISHLNVNKWLEVLGLTPDDVEIVFDVVFGLAGKLTMAGCSLLIKPLVAPSEIARERILQILAGRILFILYEAVEFVVLVAAPQAYASEIKAENVFVGFMFQCAFCAFAEICAARGVKLVQ